MPMIANLKPGWFSFQEVFTDFADFYDSREDFQANDYAFSLPSKMAKLFDANSELPFSDVKLVCGEACFPCHKFILSTR